VGRFHTELQKQASYFKFISLCCRTV